MEMSTQPTMVLNPAWVVETVKTPQEIKCKFLDGVSTAEMGRWPDRADRLGKAGGKGEGTCVLIGLAALCFLEGRNHTSDSSLSPQHKSQCLPYWECWTSIC